MSAAPRIPTTRYRAARDVATICPGCRTELPAHATFCVECGLCMLDVTSEGTVIAMHPEWAEGRPMEVIEDRSSEAIELSDEDLEIDIDALVADILEEDPGPAENKMTSKFRRVPPAPPRMPRPRHSASATLSSDLSETISDEIEVEVEVEVEEVELSDTEIETFFEDISSPINLERGPLTPVSQWPAPAPGNTVVGPVPTH